MFRKILNVLASGWSDLVRRPPDQLPALDGLRALAVLLVIGDHFAVTIWRRLIGADAWWLHSAPLRYGWSGVDLFFVLSGFLIGGQLWRERLRTGRVEFGRFWMRRAMRIWPLYFVTLALMALGLGSVAPRLPDWLLLSNYLPTPYARSWSLSTEEMFYLLVPVLVVLMPRLRTRYIAAALVALLGLVDVARMWAFQSGRSAGLAESVIATRAYAPFHLHCEGLIIGLLISLIATHRPAAVAPSDSRAFSFRGALVFAGAAAMAALLRVAGGQVFSFTSLALIYGGATYFMLMDRSPISAPFRWKLFFPISRLSYGMYLNHLIFGYGLVASALVLMRNSDLGPAAVFSIGLALAIAIAMAAATITFLVVEHPFLLLRKHLTGRRKPGAVVITTAAPDTPP